MNKTKTGYIIPHTHWDREWRYPIWENRLYLVKLMDELIETLENNPDYKNFLLDGQVIPILDYLQVRPDTRDKLVQFIKDGRIDVGPWYTLPDLYPISGESIVRNLLKGRREANKLGNCLDIGYESFGWGQPSQLPQIYKGFGIDTVIVSKNVDKKRAPHCEFKWTGKDGTSVYATRLGEDARANFFMNAYIHIMNGVAYKSDNYNFDMGNYGQVYHQADSENYIQDYFKIEDTEKIHPEVIKEAVTRAWNGMEDTLMPDDRAMMDGTDSTTGQPQLMNLIQAINEQFDDIEFKSSSLGEYVEILKEKLNLDELIEIHGEMRDGPTTSLSGNALMTRPHIKTLNKKVQNTLFNQAEPLSVANMMVGGKYDETFLQLALDYMLLSHAHDSINGVTQDKTVDDVLYRLNQALEISNAISNKNCQELIRHIDLSQYNSKDIVLVVFNSYAKPRNEMVKAYIDTPQAQNIWEFDLVDSDGNVCEIQHISRTEVTSPVVHLQARPFPYYSDRHCVVFETGEIPAGGYKVYKLCNKVEFNRKTEFWAKTRTTDGKEIATSSTCMQNEFIKVEVNSNGTISILDKENGNCFDNLNYFESTGDVGDYWMYYPPYHNKTYNSKGCNASIFLIENGNLAATIGVKLTMELPKYSYRPDNYVRGKSERSELTGHLSVTTYYTLKKDARNVEVKVEIDNNCKDHRMSVLFDTGIQARSVDAQGHFTVDNRDVTPLKDDRGHYYNELLTQPLQNFVSIADDHKGFGIVTDCLGEYRVSPDCEHKDGGDGTLSMTLFRAVKNIICTEWRSAGVFPNQEGGQLQQKLVYNYAIRPMNSSWENSDLSEMADCFNSPLKPVQTCVPAMLVEKSEGTLPPKHSFYQVTGKLSVSCIKKAEDSNSIIVRLFNPYPTEQSGSIILGCDVQNVCMTNLNEEEEAASNLTMIDNAVELKIKPNKIVTLKLDLA